MYFNLAFIEDAVEVWNIENFLLRLNEYATGTDLLSLFLEFHCHLLKYLKSESQCYTLEVAEKQKKNKSTTSKSHLLIIIFNEIN